MLKDNFFFFLSNYEYEIKQEDKKNNTKYNETKMIFSIFTIKNKLISQIPPISKTSKDIIFYNYY